MSVIEVVTLSTNIEVTENETFIEIVLPGTQGIPGPQGPQGPTEYVGNIDGGTPESIYGGTNLINGGEP